MKIFRFSRIFLVLSLIVTTQSVFADNSSTMSVEPTMLEKNVAGGEVINEKITITNSDNLSHIYYLSIRDIKDVLDGGIPILLGEKEEKTGFELSSWVKLPATSIVVDKKSAKSIPVQITVPKVTTPGAHFGEIFISLSPPKVDIQGAGAGVGYELGSIISLRVAGKTIDEAQIREFRTDKLLYGEDKLTVTFLASLANMGNTVIRPQGFINVTDMFGKKVKTLELNENRSAIIPGGRKAFDILWDDQAFAFGKYTAGLAFLYGEGEEGKKTLYSTTSFWVLPSSVVLYLLLAIFLIALCSYLFAKMYVKRQMRSQGRGDGAALHRTRISRLTLLLSTALLFTLAFFMGLLLFFA